MDDADLANLGSLVCGGAQQLLPFDRGLLFHTHVALSYFNPVSVKNHPFSLL